LGSFANEITKELIESKKTILGDDLKKPRRRQIMEELERQSMESLKLTLNFKHSEVEIPKKSNSTEMLILRFDEAKIVKHIKKHHKMSVPSLKTDPLPSRIENLVIDMNEEFRTE
jgi:uncharacterized protein YecA (UPF0149 family)